MEVSDYLNQSGMESIIQEAQFLRYSGKRVSDIVDKEGFQYVDLVQKGNGLVDYALVGYSFALEEAGIRFFNIAGIGAASLHTMLLGSAGKLDQHKSVKILKTLNKFNYDKVLKGNQKSNKFLSEFLNNKKTGRLSTRLNFLRIAGTLQKKNGMNPISPYKNWLQQIFSTENVPTMAEVQRLRQQIPEGLKHRSGQCINDLVPRLAIFTSDITTHSTVEFPKMAELYWKDPSNVSPSEFVSLGTSYPMIFEPGKVSNIPNHGTSHNKKWISHNSYYGTIPQEATFSQDPFPVEFPIDIFHNNESSEPSKPTFGVTSSGIEETQANQTIFKGHIELSRTKQIQKEKAIMNHPDYNHLICRISEGNSAHPFCIDLTDEQKLSQFKLGASAAVEFLNNFNWKSYKSLRKSMNTVSSGANNLVRTF